ncbi:MAG: hypothetical protein HZC42_06160 [Candidatus Eisenbacteria bacterium]|nr:hypothetical protein [Candidatus Eisenbacteria bacterium]
MVRFSRNRWWTLILAFCLCSACAFASARLVSAGAIGDPTQTGDPTMPNGSGDPDVPDGAGKNGGRTVSRGGLQGGALPASRTQEARPVGDGAVSQNVMMWRLQLVLQGLRSFYIRF